MDSPIRLLVVEDDPGHALLLQRMLRRGGVKEPVVVLEDGKQALSFLERDHRPGEDVMLLDLHLPVLDGMSLLREIRSKDSMKDLRVIVVSTSLDPTEEAQCHSLGCQSFLTKPVSYEEFQSAIQRLGVQLQE